MTMAEASVPALVIIDMQLVMQQRIDAGRHTVNPDAATRIAALAVAFRRRGAAVLHVHHRDDDASSPLHPAASGYPPIPQTAPRAGERVFVKRTSSAFASTDLAAHLAAAGIGDLVVTGAVAGFCVDSTVRAGVDLGLAMTVASDAVIGFDLPQAGLPAQTIFVVTMAHLAADFAAVRDTAAIMGGLR